MNAHKMDIVMPYFRETMERFYDEVEVEIEAIIQREYTAIHPSVYWKFRQEASLHVGIKTGSELPYKQIKFENVELNEKGVGVWFNRIFNPKKFKENLYS